MAKKHIKTLSQATLKESAAKGGCGECQTSCQSACKTSCTVANQECERQYLHKIQRELNGDLSYRSIPFLKVKGGLCFCYYSSRIF